MTANVQMTSRSTIHFLYEHFLIKIKTHMEEDPKFVHCPINSSLRDPP